MLKKKMLLKYIRAHFGYKLALLDLLNNKNTFKTNMPITNIDKYMTHNKTKYIII